MIKNCYSIGQSKFRYERNNGLASETIPDMSLSIKDILEKFTTGNMPAIARKPMYNNQDEFEDIDDFGVIDDQLTHNQEVMNEIDEIHKSASERRRQRKAAASRNARANDDEGGGGESIAENAAADTAEPLTAQGKRSATEGQSTNKT